MEKQTRPLPPSPPPTSPLSSPLSLAAQLCPSLLLGDNLETSSAAPQVDTTKTVCVCVCVAGEAGVTHGTGGRGRG